MRLGSADRKRRFTSGPTRAASPSECATCATSGPPTSEPSAPGAASVPVPRAALDRGRRHDAALSQNQPSCGARCACADRAGHRRLASDQRTSAPAPMPSALSTGLSKKGWALPRSVKGQRPLETHLLKPSIRNSTCGVPLRICLGFRRPSRPPLRHGDDNAMSPVVGLSVFRRLLLRLRPGEVRYVAGADLHGPDGGATLGANNRDFLFHTISIFNRILVQWHRLPRHHSVCCFLGNKTKRVLT